MKALNQNFKKTVSIPNQVLTVSTNGSAVDTYLENRPAFETALIDIAIGALGTQASTGVKIEESDDATFATGVSVAKGGEEVTVAASTYYKREVERTKQYHDLYTRCMRKTKTSSRLLPSASTACAGFGLAGRP